MADQEKQYEVFTPAKDFTGRRYGVVFKNGKGIANKHQATVLVGNWHYKCPQLEEELRPKPPALKIDMVEEPKPEAPATVVEVPAEVPANVAEVPAQSQTNFNNPTTKFQHKPKGR